MVDFAGWEMPQQYSSVREEHAAVRGAAGLFDVSHMGRVAFRGTGAARFLQRLVTNDVGSLAPGHAQYNLLCNEEGGILDDLVVYRLPDGSWSTVVNASNREPDLAWMRAQAGGEAEVVDRSQETALLALQGPRAEAVLSPLAPAVDLAAIPYFGVAEGRLADVDGVGISRTGYENFDVLVGDAHRLVSECPCEKGCPSCVQSPKCGNLNEPLSKAGAIELMAAMQTLD